ncbi:MAG: ATP synthase F1 subunit gamma [Clostridium sp.]|uniref:ATP synthase F1 subunit gamma n=1 Tax=Clostridium sp. TaxID=1506 RepID=UPI003F3DF9E3
MQEMSLLEIKKRIKSIRSTQKITKAMELISISKLRVAKELKKDNEAYFTKIKEIREEIGFIGRNERSIFKEEGKGDTILFIVIGSDSGLCGNFSGQGIDYIKNNYEKEKKLIISLGGRVSSYIKKYKLDKYKEFIDFNKDVNFMFAKEIQKEVLDLYKDEKLKEVRIVYSKYVSSIKSEILDEKLLPFNPEVKEIEEVYSSNKSERGLLEFFIKKYIKLMIIEGCIESRISEENLRMQTMNMANKNADEMLKSLNIRYNRARQSNITRELTEIISGAEAQK